jgi:hypothetical protein
MVRATKSTRAEAQEPAVLWLGCFEVEEPGATVQLGSFQMLVEASTVEIALERCKKRLLSLRATTTLFARPCEITLLHIIKLDGGFADPVLVNYFTGVDPDHQAFIYSAAPEQPERNLESYGPRVRKGSTEESFLDFGAANFRAALAKATSQSLGGPAAPTLPRPPPRSRRGRS